MTMNRRSLLTSLAATTVRAGIGPGNENGAAAELSWHEDVDQKRLMPRPGIQHAFLNWFRDNRWVPSGMWLEFAWRVSGRFELSYRFKLRGQLAD
jgi:hypothetical protein